MKKTLVFLTLFLTTLLTANGQIWASSECEDSLGEITKNLIQTIAEKNHFQTLEITPDTSSGFKAKTLTKGNASEFGENGSLLLKYFKDGKALRREFNTLSKDQVLDKIETVIYPASGTDSVFPYLLFPDAKLVVLIDNHPFATSSQTGFRSIHPKEGSSWRAATEVDVQKSLGSSILSNLTLTVPNFRLQKITLFGPEKGPKRNALIEFDQGEGTARQKLLFVSDHANKKVSDQWWSDAIQNSNSVAILIKGAMGFPFNYFFNEVLGFAKPQTILGIGSTVEIGFAEEPKNLKTYETKKVAIGYGGNSGESPTVMYRLETSD